MQPWDFYTISALLFCACLLNAALHILIFCLMLVSVAALKFLNEIR
jgi:hypothetical protein